MLLLVLVCKATVIQANAQEIEEDIVAKQEGFLNLQRISSNPGISDENGNYSLEGASYGIYLEQECETEIGTLITVEDGSTNMCVVSEGTYYIKEKSASKGYKPSLEVGAVSVSEGLTTTITMESEPQTVVVENLIRSLPNSQFRVQLFEEYISDGKLADDLSSKQEWILKADENGIVKLHPDYILSGDEFWLDQNGQSVLPLGTIVIQQTLVSQGYEKNENLYLVNLEEGTEKFCELEVPVQVVESANTITEESENEIETVAEEELETELDTETEGGAKLPNTGGFGIGIMWLAGGFMCITSEKGKKKEEK